MRKHLAHSHFWRRALASVITVCMLLGMLPVFPGLVTTARAAEETESGGTDAYGFSTEIPSDYDEGDGKNPFGRVAVENQVNINPVKELGIYESAAGYQLSRSLKLDGTWKWPFYETEYNTFETMFNLDKNHYTDRSTQLVQYLSGDNVVTQFQDSDYGELNYVRGVAFDPTGSGRDDHIAYYGYVNPNRNKDKANQPGVIIVDAKEANSSNKVTYLKRYSNVPASSDDYTWVNGLEYNPFKADGYNAMVAGDFNGDGEDTLIFYNPTVGSLRLMEMRDINLDFCGKEINFGQENLSFYNGTNHTLNEISSHTRDKNDEHKCRNIPMVHLAAGDLDGDDIEELVVTVSFSDLADGIEEKLGKNNYEDKNTGSTASLVLVYKTDKNGDWQKVFRTQLADVYDDTAKNWRDKNTETGYEGWFLRSAASAIGDFDGDSKAEIVTVGIPADDKCWYSDDVVRTALMITTIDCGEGADGTGYELRTCPRGGVGTNGPPMVPVGTYVRNESSTGWGDWADAESSYADNPPISVGCVLLEGFGTRPYLFAQGHIFQLGDNGRFEAAKMGANETDKYVSYRKYVGQPVIGNFDGNTAGRESVFFVVGNKLRCEFDRPFYDQWTYRGDKHWIAGLTFDPGTNEQGVPTKKVMDGTGLYATHYGTNVYERWPWYSACVALTAPDIDTDDGMLAHYERKQYTFADPEIMAILEASPYFEDLVDEYPETSGSTAFGTSTGGGTGSSETSSTSAGAYVSFEQEFQFLFFEAAKFEMEASFSSEWSNETEKTTEYSYDMSYEIGRDYNQVLLMRTPVIVYTYTVTDTDGNKSEMNISEAQEPAYYLMPIERYNELAGQLGDPVIGPDIVSAVPGQPQTYRTSEAGTRRPTMGSSNWMDASSENTVNSQSISVSSSTTVTKELTHSFDTKIGAGAGGFCVGATAGASSGSAQSVTSTSGLTYSGTVAGVPKDFRDDYGFQWKFFTWEAQIEDYIVPVLSYIIKPNSVKQPPSRPTNLAVVPDEDTAILTWEAGYNTALWYEVALYLEEDDEYYTLGRVSEAEEDEDGDYYTFTATGLKPDVQYQYTVRAVGYDGTQEVYSGYTTPVSVVIGASGQALPIISKHPEDARVRPGSDASFLVSAQFNGGPAAQLNFQWQSRKSGSGVWKPVDGAREYQLTLPAVTQQMDGTEYRCMVSGLTSSMTKVSVYSDVATLWVGKDRSDTTLEVGNVAGQSNYTATQTDTKRVTKTYVVDKGSGTYESYQAYVNNFEGGSADQVYLCQEDGLYYLLNGLTAQQPDEAGIATAVYDSKIELTALADCLVDGSGKLVVNLEDLRSDAQRTEEINGETYNLFAAQGVAVKQSGEQEAELTQDQLVQTTLTLYQKKDTSADPKFYVYLEGGDGVSTLQEVKKFDGDAYPEDGLENLTYLGDPQEVWSDVPGTVTENETPYEVYAYGGGTDEEKVYKNGEFYYIRTEDTQSSEEPGGEDKTVVTYTKLELKEYGGILGTAEGGMVTPLAVPGNQAETAEIKVYREEKHDGEPVTLTATVAGPGSTTGSIVFQIINTTTGAAQSISAERTGDGPGTASWIPKTPGVYQIIAQYQGSGATMPSSSAPITYYAYRDQEATGYDLKLADSVTYGELINPQFITWKMEGGELTTDSTAGGAVFTAYPFLGTGAAGADENGFDTTALTWKRGQTLVPGRYRIAASKDGEIVASKVLTVEPRPITVTAPKLADISAEKLEDFNLNDYLGEITLTPGLVSADETIYGETLSDLFCLTGGPEPVAGPHDLMVAYAADMEDAGEVQRKAKEDFLSKYVVELKKSVVTVLANAFPVRFEADINGTLTGSYASGTTITSGNSLPAGSNLLFLAEPIDPSFQVQSWTVNNQRVVENTDKIVLGNGGLSLNYFGLDQALEVQVTFTSSSTVLNFRAEGSGGTLTAINNGKEITGPTANVVAGSTVIFNAKPGSGYVVREWKVDGVVQTYDGTDTVFAQNALTLENVAEGPLNVTVSFEQKRGLTVTYGAVDERGADASGVTFKTDDLTATGTASGTAVNGSQVTITAELLPGVSPIRWEVEQADGSWAQVSGASETFTIQNLQNDMNVRLVVSDEATTFRLTFDVVDQSGAPIADAGTLRAFLGDREIFSGKQQIANSQIDFVFDEAEDYELVRWEKDGWGVSHDREQMRWSLAQLSEDTTVNVVVARKPKVTIDVSTSDPDASDGFGDVTATADGAAVNSGDYVYNGTELIFTAAPGENYRVGSIEVNGEPQEVEKHALTDNQTFTVRTAESEEVVVAVEFEKIPTYTITHSVHEVDGSAHGTLRADASRKKMPAYLQEDFASGTPIHEDSTLTFTAVPDEGYRVQKWTWTNENGETEDIMAQGSEASFYIGLELPVAKENLRRENTVTVEFTAVGDRVNFGAVDGVITSAKLSGGTEAQQNIVLNPGASITFTAEGNTGYEIQHWTVNGLAQEGSDKTEFTYSVPVDADKNKTGAEIRAVFQPIEYPVAWSGDRYGQVLFDKRADGDDAVRGGTEMLFTAKPKAGYELDRWMVDGEEAGGGNELKWTVPVGVEAKTEPYQIQAVFRGGSYTLTYEQPEHGTLTADVEGSEVTGGQTVLFTAVPEENYEVAYWTVNKRQVNSTDETYSLTIQGDTTVSVTMARNTHTVTFSATEGGTVAAVNGSESPATVSRHGSFTLIAEPDPYYDLLHWRVGGEVTPGEAGEPFTLTDIIEDMEVQAVFASQGGYNVKFSAGENGKLTATQNGEVFSPGDSGNTVAATSTLVFTAEPNTGADGNHMVARWTVNGKPVTWKTMDELDLDIEMEHPLSNKLTVPSLDCELEVRVEFEPYQGFDIPTSGAGYTIVAVERIPAEAYPGAPDTQIRKGGNLTFTVKPDEDHYLTELTINGTDCLSGSVGENLTVVRNEDGSVTIAISDVAKEITLGATSLQFQTVQSELTAVPDELAGKFSTIQQLQAALRTEVTRLDSRVGSNISLLDIRLQYTTDGGLNWQNATKEQFPEGGIKVSISYDDLGAGLDDSYNYTVIHMFTTDMNGHIVGDSESIKPAKSPDGISFTVTSLSPFAIGWSKPAAIFPGGGVVSAGHKITLEEAEHGMVTADRETAEKGDKVLLTIRPEAGYELDTLTITGKSGTPVTLLEEGQGYAFLMPDEEVTIRAAFRIEIPWDNPFTDVSGDAWYYEAVKYVCLNGLMGGTGDTTFSPDISTSRSMIATILWRLDGSPDMENEPWGAPYQDVDADSWYGTAVYWARLRNVAGGYGNGTFGPDDIITREQLAAMLYRYAGQPPVPNLALVFDDADQVSDFADNAMRWAVDAGIINGKGSGILDPQGRASRAEAAAMLMRFCQQPTETK
ncbi:InlB B-repeat-containing protein [Feifania hominis]|uniref:S-layer homology domain-containing protein n=1 Tax=Feifania hominis TaxID=2763660 RepID=A0A926HV14_9FIRM|nr:S-layer homology domain-containing protein [Feifania hominis]MBC8536136.1 S-layer homology domain-containing protein [Feifania hominis]